MGSTKERRWSHEGGNRSGLSKPEEETIRSREAFPIDGGRGARRHYRVLQVRVWERDDADTKLPRATRERDIS